MQNLQILKRKTLIDDLFYLLSGFDTSNLFLIDNPISITSQVYDISSLIPFEFLIIKIREFYNIQQFDCFIQEYLKKLALLKDQTETLEELFVNLQEYFQLFRDLDKIYNIAFKSDVDFPFSNIKINTVINNNGIIKKFQDQENELILKNINRWINKGDPTNLVEVKELDPFLGSHWRDMFKIKQISLSNQKVSKNLLEGIEEVGKIVFFTRMLFGIEIVDEEGNDTLKPLNFSGDIISRKVEISEIFNRLVSKQLISEIEMIENIILLQNGIFFSSIFEVYESELFSSDFNSFDSKLNHLIDNYNSYPINNNISTNIITNNSTNNNYKSTNNIIANNIKSSALLEFKLLQSTLGDYITKLLKYQKTPHDNTFLINIQRVGVQLKKGLINYFIPKKTCFELEILFRFLFSISSCIFYLERSKGYNFSRVLLLIFMKIKSYELKICKDSLTLFDDSISTAVSDFLKKFYITNCEIFSIWSKMIDISLEYLQIEYKEHISVSHYEEEVKKSVLELIELIIKNYGECEFTEFLKNLSVEKYL